jgi:NAD(P)-dependent dehydrogenase (short-subunit alcohol dehydrogenase family)
MNLVCLAAALTWLGSAQETAATVAFPASDQASYVTGAVLVTGAGRTVLTAGAG